MLLLVGHALVDDRPRWWLAAGLVAGIGLNNKHAVAFLLLGLLVSVAAVRETRGQLRTPYPWLGGLLALLLWLPNLAWQAAHGWPVLALSADIADEYGGLGGRVALVGQALVMYSPLVAVLWVYGLVVLLRRPEWARARPVGMTFVVVAAVFLVTGGKGYYLAGLVAAAGRRREHVPSRSAGRSAGWSPPGSSSRCRPSSPGRRSSRCCRSGPTRGRSSRDRRRPAGDDRLARAGRDGTRTVADLPPAQRRTAVVFTGNYGEAGALQWYGVGRPVYSGHNGWADWGPPPGAHRTGRRGRLVPAGRRAHRLPPRADDRQQRVGIDNEERGQGVWVCDGPRGSWSQRWRRAVPLRRVMTARILIGS